MQINRYINGKPVSEEELSRAGIVTEALENAVRGARKRANALPERAENSAEGEARRAVLPRFDRRAV